MLAKTMTASLIGIDSYHVQVEVDIGMGLPSFSVVGLPDTAIQEARERVRSAIRNSRFDFPSHRITVNLAPANLKKDGAQFDLPIAVGILAASEFVPQQPGNRLFYGELSLDGRVRSTSGLLAVLLSNLKEPTEIFISSEDLNEAALVSSENIRVYAVENLAALIKHLRNESLINPVEPLAFKDLLGSTSAIAADFADIKGQEQAKRALEIAAAGHHNILMTGPPGSGKTMLARTLPTILPPFSLEEALAVTRLYSVAGLLQAPGGIVVHRPFRSPHHTASAISIIGGGASPRPGEISLAHHGILFLDELPEFPKSVLEVLRQPLEDRIVTISRAAGSLQFPADFMFVAACNPCPCGNLNNPDKPCVCAPSQVLRYQKKLSGPLLDRIDIHLTVPKVKPEDLMSAKQSESSKTIQARVTAARDRQKTRFEKGQIFTNAQMKNQDIKRYCQFEQGTSDFLKQILSQYKLSARSFYRLIKVAQTITDLEQNDRITVEHLAEACQYRPEEQTRFN